MLTPTSTLLYPSLCWNDARWSAQKAKDRYKDHLVDGKLTRYQLTLNKSHRRRHRLSLKTTDHKICWHQLFRWTTNWAPTSAARARGKHLKPLCRGAFCFIQSIIQSLIHLSIINTIELKMIDFKNISRLEERVNQAVINRIIQVKENVQIWDEKAGSEFAKKLHLTRQHGGHGRKIQTIQIIVRMLAVKKQLAGHGRHHNPSEAVHRRSTGTRGCCPEKRNGQWREKILLNIILNYMYLKTFQLPGGTERASTQTILFAALQNSQHCRKVPLWFHYKKNWLWGIRKKMIFQTRPRLNMKNKRKRLSFKLDQAGLKTIRDPAWACKHAQQSQYKHPATAFSLASWILDIHSHSAKCIGAWVKRH